MTNTEVISKEEQYKRAADALTPLLKEKYGFVDQTMLDKALADVMKRTDERVHGKKDKFSITKMIRGLRVISMGPGSALNGTDPADDAKYVEDFCKKVLVTTGTPGSYLVPTIQVDEIIQYLYIGGVARNSGVRIWPMAGIQKMTIPTALAAPTWVWSAQNSATTPSDPNLGQMAFDLKERRTLIAIPNQLLAVSVPAFDTVISQLIGASGAEHEDTAFFATSTVSGGPTALMSAASISTLLVGSSANGGNLAYSDILAAMAKAASVKAKPPFVWYSSPRTYFQRLLGLIDLQSRPIFIPANVSGLYEAPKGAFYVGMLMGWPVYVTPFILENETNGSGSNQSHLIFTNPTYCHIAQNDAIALAISTEFLFSSNQTAIRATQEEDFGFAPPAGITVLLGIN